MALTCSALPQHCPFTAACSPLPVQLGALKLLSSFCCLCTALTLYCRPRTACCSWTMTWSTLWSPACWARGPRCGMTPACTAAGPRWGPPWARRPTGRSCRRTSSFARTPMAATGSWARGASARCAHPAAPHLQAHREDAVDAPAWQAADAHLHLQHPVHHISWVGVVDSALDWILALPALATLQGCSSCGA